MSLPPVHLDADLATALTDLAVEVAQPYREAVAGLPLADAIRELETEALQVCAPLGRGEAVPDWATLRHTLGITTDAQWVDQLCLLIALGLMTQRAVDDLGAPPR